MLSIHKSIQESDLYNYLYKHYENLSLEDIEEIPKKYIIKNITINNIDDLYSLIDLLNYWMANEIPDEILNWVFDNNIGIINKEKSVILDKINFILKNKFYLDSVNFIESCVIKDYFDLFKFFIKKYYKSLSISLDYDNIISIITHVNDKKYINFFFNNNLIIPTNICDFAAQSGNINILKYLHDELYFPLNKTTMVATAECGNLECMKYLFENGCEWDEKVTMYSARTNFECLQFSILNNCPKHPFTCLFAAISGNIKALQFAHENNCYWDEKVCSNSANVECLKYAHENGCPWDEYTCSTAAIYNRFECLKYAHENGCPWDKTTCSNAVANNSLESLIYAHQNNCPFENNLYMEADKYNSIKCLDYILDFMIKK